MKHRSVALYKKDNLRKNVTLRCVLATIITAVKHCVLHIRSVCIFSIRYPACNAHAPCCHLWPARCTVFSTLSHKRHDFRKKMKHACNMCVSSFFTTLSETIFIQRRTERDMIKNVYWSSCKVTFFFFLIRF